MSLVEKVKKEIQGIIDEQLQTLGRVEGRVAQSVQETSDKITDLIQSYSELEKTLGNLPSLGLLGLTSDTAKVIDWDKQKETLGAYADTSVFQIAIGSRYIFQDHPAGDKFKLDPKKKYKILVAFIPVEKSG